MSQDLSQLTWLNMSNNQISAFGRNPFARNSKLGWLSLSHNLLKEVKGSFFRSMRYMRRLYLSDNLIAKVSTLLKRSTLRDIFMDIMVDFIVCEL